ncbi:MAG: HAMP domain-containing sensor histidine kinase [Gemmatimonadota bacterium]|nr:HAMP domain-containing sensor histidine kinase [Gemmatimonadota bacterium]
MKVGTRLGGGYLLLIIVFGGLLAFYQRTVQRTIETGREIATVDSRVSQSATGILDLVSQSTEDAEKFRITLDPGYFEAYVARRGAIGDSIAVLSRLELRGGQSEALRELVEDWEAFQDRYPVDAERASARFLATAADTAAWTIFRNEAIALDRRVRDLRGVAQAAVAGELRNLADDAERAADFAVLGLAAAVLLAGTLVIWILRSIVRPLERIEAGAAAVAQGDFAVRLGLHGRDELAHLGRSFDRMTEQLAEIEKTKSDFLAKMSHDLKTPLASVREVKKLLLDEVPGELAPKQRRLLELGLANADRLSVMIERLLELARLEAGVESYDLEPVDLAALASETVERWAVHADGTSVTVDAPDGPVWVTGDRFALQRVFENLLENALAHGGGGVRVVVERASTGNGARAIARVLDDGPGIPEGEREGIFEAFARGREAAPGAGHVGLGLAICREIIVRHEGRIRVDEPPPGTSGAAFTFDMAARA